MNLNLKTVAILVEDLFLAQSPLISPLLQISGYTLESNHVFALLIFMPPEFSLMPHFKRINFYQNNLKI